MGKFVLGLLLGLLLIPLGGYLYLKLGLAPAATAASPMPFEKTLANMALQARIAAIPADARIPILDENDPANEARCLN